MTLQPIPSKFPYMWGKFRFLFYQCKLYFVLQAVYWAWPPSSSCPTPAAGTSPFLFSLWNYLILLGMFEDLPIKIYYFTYLPHCNENPNVCIHHFPFHLRNYLLGRFEVLPIKIYYFLISRTASQIPWYVFLFWELRGLSPNFHIFMCLWAIYIFPGSIHIYFLQQNRQIDCGNIKIAHRHINVDIGTVAAQFLF